MKYALIGKKLGHSFSKVIHGKMGLDYNHIELEENAVQDFVRSSGLNGFNVTIPYKELAYKFVDKLDDSAKAIGVVNTVLVKGGVTYGYNTDIFGMRYALKRKKIALKDKCVLILGSGGTCKTALEVCKQENVKKTLVCSRNGEINYNNVYDKASDAEIIINCTPVGMFPNLDGEIIDISKLIKLEAVFDCVYNPLKTKLILRAEERGLKYSNGLAMLVAQGLKSEEIWLDKKLEDDVYEGLICQLSREKATIALVGMPGSGKSAVGEILAKKLNKKLIDTDAVITQRFSSPSDIILSKGEEEFRKIESQVLDELTKTSGIILSTGGGAIIRKDNREFLKRNALVIFIDRALEKLAQGDRPLSKQKGVEKLYNDRIDYYKSVSEVTIANNGEIEKTAQEIIKYYENFSY